MEDIPEWTIQTTGELGGITHECTLISVACVNQFPFYGENPSVHHVAGSNAIRPSSGVSKGYISKTFDRRKGVDCSILVEEATVAVRGILAKANVTCDIEGRV